MPPRNKFANGAAMICGRCKADKEPCLFTPSMAAQRLDSKRRCRKCTAEEHGQEFGVSPKANYVRSNLTMDKKLRTAKRLDGLRIEAALENRQRLIAARNARIAAQI